MYIYNKFWLNSSWIRNVADKRVGGNQNTHLVLLLLLLLLLTAITFSLRGCSPYTSTVKIYKNKICLNITTLKQSKQFKYTYYQNNHTIVQKPTITKPQHTLTHTLQNELKQSQYKRRTKLNSHNTIKYPQYKVTRLYVVLLSSRTSP